MEIKKAFFTKHYKCTYLYKIAIVMYVIFLAANVFA